jgi:hypothetical protein
VGTVQLVTLIAAGLAVITVGVAGWQLWRSYRRTAEATRQADRVRELAEAVEDLAKQTEKASQDARSHAKWAWEQVKLAAGQLEQAQAEHRATSQTEEWEWAYALTLVARELVESSQELIRVAVDGQVTPNYRLAAERHYQQSAQRWQETMTKALSRTKPTLQVQHHVATFAQVQHRLHGQVGVLLRAAETGTLSSGDALTQQILGVGQELETVRRHLQRTISSDLAALEPPRDRQATQQIAKGSGEPKRRRKAPAEAEKSDRPTNGAAAQAKPARSRSTGAHAPVRTGAAGPASTGFTAPTNGNSGSVTGHFGADVFSEPAKTGRGPTHGL